MPLQVSELDMPARSVSLTWSSAMARHAVHLGGLPGKLQCAVVGQTARGRAAPADAPADGRVVAPANQAPWRRLFPREIEEVAQCFLRDETKRRPL
jgi:hypothetical protein